MTASKFEQFCGKGDAKKWKSSLLAADESGEAICTMQDWLGDHSLDRKVLQALQQNALAHDAWKNYMAGRAEERQGADTDDLKADQDDEADVPAPDAGASGEQD